MYKKLKELRKSFGYSCNYMGQKIGVTGTYYYFIESGKRGLYGSGVRAVREAGRTGDGAAGAGGADYGQAPGI